MIRASCPSIHPSIHPSCLCPPPLPTPSPMTLELNSSLGSRMSRPKRESNVPNTTLRYGCQATSSTPSALPPAPHLPTALVPPDGTCQPSTPTMQLQQWCPSQVRGLAAHGFQPHQQQPLTSARPYWPASEAPTRPTSVRFFPTKNLHAPREIVDTMIAKHGVASD